MNADELSQEPQAVPVESVEPERSRETNPPQTRAATLIPPSGDSHFQDRRLTATVLLLGGLALVLLGQGTTAVVFGNERFFLYLITALGAAAFLLGGAMVGGRNWYDTIRKPVDWLAKRLDIRGAQVLLLAMAFLLVILASNAAGELIEARSPLVSIIAWLLAIACVAAGTLRSRDDLPPPIARDEIIFTAVVFGLAFLLRGLATELIPNTFSGDEGSAGISALQFAQGDANNLFTVAWFDFPSLYFALQGLGIRLLGQNVAGVRVMSALGGALTVVAVYWLARTMFDKFIARLAAVILMASHYHIHMSRIALNNVWDGLFAAAAVCGLWYGWKTGRRIGFVLAGAALGLGQYFYVTIRILPFLVIIWLVAAWLVERAHFRRRLPGLLLTAYMSFIVFLPLALYFQNHLDQFMARIMPVTVSSDWLAVSSAGTGDSTLALVSQQLLRAASGFVVEPLRLLYNPGAPLLLVTAAALFLTGLLWALFNPDLRYLLLLLPIMATIFIVAVSKDAPSSQRYIMAVPFVIVFVALPLGLLREWMIELWPEYRRLAAVPAILVVTILLFSDLRYYFTQVYANGYILGGRNTLVATEVAYYLDEQPGAQDVYFFGFPRMGYRSHATIPYLVPRMRGHDIEPEGGIPNPNMINGPVQFIFLPERLPELQQVMSLYPQGSYREFLEDTGELLFAVYAIP